MMKKKLLFLGLLLMFVFEGFGQVKWLTNAETAVKESEKTGKPLLLFFTGSDWCGWCMKLQKEVFVTPEWQKWASEKVILLELDFPRKTQQTPELRDQNYKLQNLFGVQGYPTIVFATATVKDKQVAFQSALGGLGYVAGGPSAWISQADGILNKK